MIRSLDVSLKKSCSNSELQITDLQDREPF